MLAEVEHLVKKLKRQYKTAKKQTTLLSEGAPYSLGASERLQTVPYSHDASERLQTVPYRLYKLAEELDIVGTVPRTVRKEKRRVRGPRPTASVLRNGYKPRPTGASERLQTVPYRLYKFAEELDIVGTVPRCRDCSPNSPKSGAFRDRALQPRCFGTV